MITSLALILFSLATRSLPPPAPPSIPTSISIPAISLSTSIRSVGLTQEKIVDTPELNVGWYSGGVKPGEIGNATLNGHTPGIFTDIVNLKVGDEIIITNSSSNSLRFKVVGKDYVPKSTFPLEKVYGPTERKMLNLITCAGETHRNIIYSELVDSSSTQ